MSLILELNTKSIYDVNMICKSLNICMTNGLDSARYRTLALKKDINMLLLI